MADHNGKRKCKISPKDQLIAINKKRDRGLVADLSSKSVCIFCASSVDDEAIFGEYITHQHSGLKMHYFCLILSSGIYQNYEGILDCNTKDHPQHVYGFGIKDIVAEARRASKLRCSYCRKTGASIGCVVTSCKKKMHFPCAKANNALSQYFGNFSTWCEHHRPSDQVYKSLPFYHTDDQVENRNNILKELINGDNTQSNPNNGGDNVDVKLKNEDSHKCFACLEQLIQPYNESDILVSACCLNFYSHKVCLQRHASSCGLHCFRCPGCNNIDKFQQHLLTMGIYIPDRDASWESEDDAFQDLLHRHSKCDYKTCQCPHGRNYTEERSKWNIVLCDLCGSFGTHIACHPAVTDEKSYFVCQQCLNTMGENGAYELAQRMGIIVETSPPSPIPSPTTSTSSSQGDRVSKRKRKIPNKLKDGAPRNNTRSTRAFSPPSVFENPMSKKQRRSRRLNGSRKRYA